MSQVCWCSFSVFSITSSIELYVFVHHIQICNTYTHTLIHESKDLEGKNCAVSPETVIVPKAQERLKILIEKKDMNKRVYSCGC